VREPWQKPEGDRSETSTKGITFQLIYLAMAAIFAPTLNAHIRWSCWDVSSSTDVIVRRQLAVSYFWTTSQT
jgi:hypothetical protein